MKKGQVASAGQRQRISEGKKRQWANAAPRILRCKPNKSGYVELRLLNHPIFGTCRMYEHRYLIAMELGRVLTSKEKVHHINGDRADNRRENLHYCRDQAEHMSHHRGQKRTPEQCARVSEAKRGKKWSKPMSDEDRRRRSIAQRERMKDPNLRAQIAAKLSQTRRKARIVAGPVPEPVRS